MSGELTAEMAEYIKPSLSIYGLLLQKVSEDENHCSFVQLLHGNQILRRFTLSLLYHRKQRSGDQMNINSNIDIGCGTSLDHVFDKFSEVQIVFWYFYY